MTPLDVPAVTPPVDMEHRFFELSLDLLCFADFSGYFRRLNPAWEATLGFTRAELMARPSIEFVHPEDRERTLGQNREVKSGGQARSFENRYLCKDGSWRWLLWNATPDLDRRVIYSVARDVTARKAAEAERERLVVELQAALAEVKTLRAYLPDLLVLSQDSRRRELLAERRELHHRAHRHAVQPRHLPELLHDVMDDAPRRVSRGSQRSSARPRAAMTRQVADDRLALLRCAGHAASHHVGDRLAPAVLGLTEARDDGRLVTATAQLLHERARGLVGQARPDRTRREWPRPC